MRNLLVVRSELLPLSETFIKQQIVSLRTWQATLVGTQRAAKGLDLTGLDTQLVDPGPPRSLQRLQWRAFRKWGWPMPAVLRGLMNGPRRPELAHVHFATDAVVTWPWLRALNIPVLVTLHGYDIQTYPHWWEAGHAGDWMRGYPALLRSLASEPAVSFIAVSNAVRESAIDAYGLPPQKIKTLHIGVDTAAFMTSGVPIGERDPHILFVGRLVEKKGLEVLIKAMEIVHRQLPSASVVVVGDGPLRQAHEALATSLCVPVRFLGSQTSAQVRDLLDSAYAFCLPSVVSKNGDAEGFGLVILEAQASGVPAVTSAVGGRDEGIVDGVTGFAFPEHDHAALADRLCTLLADRPLASRMGDAARQFAVERFDLGHCTQALEAHYAECSRRTRL